MVFSGLIFFTGAFVASLGSDYIAKPELCMPKPSVATASYLKAHEQKLREKELQRLRIIVDSLGGAPEHAGFLHKAGREFKIDPIFLASVTFVESNFKARAFSNKGARGMMQLGPIALEVLGVTNPWDPHENIMAGAAYLQYCFERYGKHPNSTYLVLAAYNIGPGSVQKLENSEAAERFVRKVLTIYNRFTDVPVAIPEAKQMNKKMTSK